MVVRLLLACDAGYSKDSTEGRSKEARRCGMYEYYGDMHGDRSRVCMFLYGYGRPSQLASESSE